MCHSLRFLCRRISVNFYSKRVESLASVHQSGYPLLRKAIILHPMQRTRSEESSSPFSKFRRLPLVNKFWHLSSSTLFLQKIVCGSHHQWRRCLVLSWRPHLGVRKLLRVRWCRDVGVRNRAKVVLSVATELQIVERGEQFLFSFDLQNLLKSFWT